MTWIRTVAPGEADGALAQTLDAIASARGGVAAVHLAQSLNPRALAAHLELYKAVVFARSSLSRVARERIAVVVSAANRCDYCVSHHGAALDNLGEDIATSDPLRSGNIPASLPEVDRAMLKWAKRSAAQPWTASAEDIAELRSAGLDDRAILDAALVTAYFCFVNRLVLMLGVDTEADFARFCRDGSE